MIDFITSNEHKYNEISKKLASRGYEVSWKKLKYEEIQEDTTQKISLDSAVKLSIRFNEPFFLEDTGLYIDSLHGFPGPYSSFIFKTIGNSGILRLMESSDRKARFLTVITYFDSRMFHQFEGILEGTISEEIRGANGFGFDPIFIPAPGEVTLGEMNVDSKNRISHRSMAVEKFADFLDSLK